MIDEYLNKLKAPAIGIILTGSLNLTLSILDVASNLYMYLTRQGIYAQEQSNAYSFGVGIAVVIIILNIFLAPVLIWGGVQMMRGKSYNLSRAAAILAILPFASCCFVLGMPFGIWALVVLSKPEIKSLFRGEELHRYNPPGPPTF